MTMRQRTIGRLAKEVGVGVETIRFYERRGLLKQPRRPKDGGYRHYDDEAVRLLRYIRLAQTLNFTLKDIEQLVARASEHDASFCDAVRDTVERKLEAVRGELKALAMLEDELASFLSTCRSRSSDRPCPILAGLHPLHKEPLA